MIAIIELVKIRVGVPRFVKMQNLHRIADDLLDRVNVVAQAVVGGVRHHHQADFAAGLFGERVGRDFLGHRLGRELIARDRPDDPQAVA